MSDLGLPQQRDLIDGDLQDPGGVGEELTDPNTGDVIALAAQTTPGSVDAALAAASRLHASGTWDLDARLGLLNAFATALAERAARIARADAIDSGVPISVTTQFASALPDIVRGAMDLASRFSFDEALTPSVKLLRRPWGPAAVIAPFNVPAFSLVRRPHMRSPPAVPSSPSRPPRHRTALPSSPRP